MANSPEWIVAFAAITSVGCIPVLVNSRRSGKEMRNCLDDAGVTCVFADTKRADMLGQAGYTGRLTVLDIAAQFDGRNDQAVSS